MGTAENVFDGQPAALPEPMPRGTALYRKGSGPAVVRHLQGYGPFVDFCGNHAAGGRGRVETLAAAPKLTPEAWAQP